ncbi:MAG: DUF4149 domain-containing protein [Acidobacteriota bacterium]|nr:DUF4149 domain-containing protein [Acidobacteriota bacterium]
MALLRYLYVLALCLWLGGMVVAGGVAAPSIFGVLQAWDPVEGRVLAGRVFGEVLQRVYWLGYGCAAVMFVALTLHRLLGARPIKYGVRASILVLMVAFTLGADYQVTPQIETIQARVSGPVSMLPPGDPIREEFDRLHGLANLLLGLTVAGGLALAFWEARE